MMDDKYKLFDWLLHSSPDEPHRSRRYISDVLDVRIAQ